MPDLKIAVAQLNPIVGDVEGNAAKIAAAYEAAGADLLVTPELALSGYPPEDLVLRREFTARLEEKIEFLKRLTAGRAGALLVGTPLLQGNDLYNAALLLENGEIRATVTKRHLPNYGVFDEARVFMAGGPAPVVIVGGHRLGIMICEDMWFADCAADLKSQGAQLLIVPNGSPYEKEKKEQRSRHALARASETGLPLLYAHQVGGQDELVFDGASFLVHDNKVHQIAPDFEEALVTIGWREQNGILAPALIPAVTQLRGEEAVYRALVLGLGDYVRKNKFPGVILGLSGGVDSALAAALAVDALGADKVRAVMMPSPYTSRESLEDAAACAALLGIRLDIAPIATAMAGFEKMLQPVFDRHEPDTTEENVQARLRGMILMAISNKDGPMVVSTGNKSEMAVGYTSLYGDMCGGFAVLKDVYKTEVYALARWRNAQARVIPERIMTKAPSAELRHGQTDQDSLPPYEALDKILAGLIEDQASIDDIAAAGFDRKEVQRVWSMLIGSEYKRRQSPPGVKITSRSFGKERRYPITNRFK
jgi:NAD+ synthase